MATDNESKTIQGWLHRGRLRDVVIVASVVSVWLFDAGPVLRGAALALLLLGCALHVLVKGQLIRNVTLCNEGTYAVVRHPYYLANYLIDTSFCLASGNIYLMAAYPFLFFWAYGPTLREEETRLAGLHPGPFAAHQATVPQVFPDRTIWAGLRAIAADFSWRRVTSEEWKRISRFGYVGTLLPLLHVAKTDGFGSLLVWRGAAGWGAMVLLVLCGAFLLATLLVPRGREAEPPVAAESRHQAA
ncbi:MAG: hypothetical protein JW809_06085 [Pirellulales bacterium]|nr:hypothetical protein [Pirellulales bacterium]